MTILQSIHETVGPKELAALVAVIFLLKCCYGFVTDPLRDIPGPLMARFTKVWLLRQYMSGNFHKTNIKLHQKHGMIVRIAPGEYSIDSLQAAKTIYGHGSDFVKSSWYSTWGHPDPALNNLFNERDPKRHAEMRRKVASAYAMSSLVSYEPYVDECTSTLSQRLSEFAASGETFNMGHWFQCYAFDMIGKITFTTSFGFLDRGEDINGIIGALNENLFLASYVGLWSSWWPFVVKVLTYIAGPKATVAFRAFTNNAMAMREQSPTFSDGPTDFLGKFLAVQAKDPSKMTRTDIMGGLETNVVAGSDTTSISLSAVLYYLLRNPRCMEILRKEIDDAAREGKISDPITFAQAQALPYLQAVIKEGLRMHPAAGFTMGRVVPEGGREICGRFFPAGAVVGINSWVAHRNRDVYGADAGIFRPERWIEDPNGTSVKEGYFFSFGQGSRTCIGKNISFLEISKGIPQVIRYFDFHLEMRGKEDWTVDDKWFVKPLDFICRVRRRAT